MLALFLRFPPVQLPKPFLESVPTSWLSEPAATCSIARLAS
jgi:hypothetical protein